MTSVTAQLYGNLNVIMPDDEMEIGSPFGQNLGDDDIDIDIDFENHDHDEDQMIADYVAELPETEHLDDAMMDDETTSQQMEDVDGGIEDLPEHEMGAPSPERELETFETANAPMQDFDDFVIKDSEVDPGIDWDEQPGMTRTSNGLEDSVGPPDVVARSSEAALDHTVENAELASLPLAENTSVENSTSMTALVQAAEPEKDDSTEDEEVATKSLVNLEAEPAGPWRISEDLEQTTATPDIDPTHVVVTYQGTDYALIAITESDDPNSYFFSDGAATTSDLGTFFETLRNVLQDDLSQDEEICLLIGELGIEISEGTASSIDMSFSQIVELYRTLLQNDGITPGPLLVSISLRPDHCRRLTSLSLGAASGKGLSEVVTWADEAESFDDSIHQPSEHERQHEAADEFPADEIPAETVVTTEAGETFESTAEGSPNGMSRSSLVSEEVHFDDFTQKPNVRTEREDSSNAGKMPLSGQSEEVNVVDTANSVNRGLSGQVEQDHSIPSEETHQVQEFKEQGAAAPADLKDRSAQAKEPTNDFSEEFSDLQDEEQQTLVKTLDSHTEVDHSVKGDNDKNSADSAQVMVARHDDPTSTSLLEADDISGVDTHVEEYLDAANGEKVEGKDILAIEVGGESVNSEEGEIDFDDDIKVTPKSNESEGTLFEDQTEQAAGGHTYESAEFDVEDVGDIEDVEDMNDASGLRGENLSQLPAPVQRDNMGKRLHDSTEQPDSNDQVPKRIRT